MEPRSEMVHWLFGAGLLLLGLMIALIVGITTIVGIVGMIVVALGGTT